MKELNVKCSSYIQSWDQEKHSVIRWSGLKAGELYYSDAINKRSEIKKEKEHKADIYVFLLFKHIEYKTLDILDMNQWDFYVLSKKQLKEISGDRTRISLRKLEKNNIEPVGFNDLKSIILI
jgi:hypothetical protein